MRPEERQRLADMIAETYSCQWVHMNANDSSTECGFITIRSTGKPSFDTPFAESALSTTATFTIKPNRNQNNAEIHGMARIS